MSKEAIRQELDADGVLLLAIDCPGLSMNVIDDGLIRELSSAVERIRTDAQVKGAVITSGKASGFVAGADLKSMDFRASAGEAKGTPMAQIFEKSFALSQLLRALETCGKPVVAAVNGLALGGGLELVLACHYRLVANDNPKLVLGLPEVLIGLLPGGGGTQRLPRLIGVQPALLYLLQGKNMKPDEALQLGVVQQLLPGDQLVAAARDWVKANPKGGVQPWDQPGFRFPGGAGATNPAFVQTFIGASAIAHRETHGNMNQVRGILSAVYEGAQLPMDAALRTEGKYFARVLADPQAANMVRTLFVSKQAAEKGARRPADIPPMPTRKLGVLGAGMMGAGIALVSAQAGIEVVLLDRDLAAAEKGRQYSVDKIARRRLPAEKAAEILGRIKPTADYADLAGCDFIIEAVFEARDVKADVTHKAEAVVGADTIFGSNTSTLPITGLAENWSKPEHFIGVHFFSPVDRMPLVELIVGRKTGPEAIAKALDYVAQIRKTPIVVNDGRGFYTSRCFSTYVQEGLAMLEEGGLPALIDNIGRQMGMPVGPLAVNDEVGIDLSYKIAQQTKKDLGDAYVAGPGERATEQMMALDRHGRKNGKGFYVYPEDGSPKYLWPQLADYFPVAKIQPSPAEVRERLFYRQLVETARCFAEGVVETPQDGDLGAVFGWGFAPFTGGPFSAMDTIGLAQVVETLDRLTQKHGDRFAPPQLLRDMAARNQRFYDGAVQKAA